MLENFINSLLEIKFFSRNLHCIVPNIQKNGFLILRCNLKVRQKVLEALISLLVEMKGFHTESLQIFKKTDF